MKEGERLADVTVAQRRRPAACVSLGVLLEIGLDRLNEQNVGEPRNDDVGAGPSGGEIVVNLLERALKPGS